MENIFNEFFQKVRVKKFEGSFSDKFGDYNTYVRINDGNKNLEIQYYFLNEELRTLIVCRTDILNPEILVYNANNKGDLPVLKKFQDAMDKYITQIQEGKNKEGLELLI